MRAQTLHIEAPADEHDQVGRYLRLGRTIELRLRIPQRSSKLVCKTRSQRSTLLGEVRQFLIPAAAEPALSRNEFERCATTNPTRLETLLRSGLEDPLLTFAAEAVALVVEPQPSLIAALAQLLHHEKTYVREGACYGARPHLENPMLRAELTRIAAEDVSETLREIAQEILDASP